ncbi:hypothetical protein RB595_002577 [Gaeumannomyces hyphopodioides]
MAGPAVGNQPASGGKWGGRDPVVAMQREQMNFQVATNYAAFLASIVGVFIILHWSRYLATAAQQPAKTPSFPRFISLPFVRVSRMLRNLLLRKIPGFHSSGHGVLVSIYVAVNVAMIFTNIDLSRTSNLAARCGWSLTTNLAFVVFLALKNTPLAILTSYSYERLNNLHQIAGCTTFFMLVMHASLYTQYFAAVGRWDKLREHEQIAGIVSAFAFLALVATALLMRRFWYEAFYVAHLASFVTAIVAMAFHRPDFSHKTPIIACVAGGMWVLDRAIRMARLAVNGVNNEATVYPLAGGGTRIMLAKRPAGAVPGKHCFVWIPSIRRFETHPFTIIDTAPMEFVVKTHDGFTRDLHRFAVANPGATVPASVDGPYGTFPDPMLYDRIVLIAGGSGASFTFGLAVNLLERMGPESTKSITFIWIVRKHETLTWYAEHLRMLHDHPNSPKCKISLYATRATETSGSSSDEAAERPRLRTSGVGMGNGPSDRSPTSPDLEKVLREALPAPAAAAGDYDEKKAEVHETHSEARIVDDKETGAAAGAGAATDPEAASQSGASASTSALPLRHAVTAGRPDASQVIRAAVAETPAHQRVLVAACGPDSLVKVVRDTTAECIRGDGPGIELHCEKFGW